jgi:hypothetical protein
MSLFADANFWFCFVVLVVATILGIKHVIGDIAFASLFTAISVMYCYTAHKIDVAEIQSNVKYNDLPDKGKS